MVRTTREQRVALKQKWSIMLEAAKLHGEAVVCYRQFRKAVQPTFGMDGAVVVAWCGMWVCIEKDGYAHT